MFTKIKVIPHIELFNAETGATASAYGAKPPGYELRETGNYTWECTKRDGSITIGLHRVPAKTKTIAMAVAHLVAGRSPDCEVAV